MVKPMSSLSVSREPCKTRYEKMKIHKFKVDKLIRDKLVEILRNEGITVYERQLNPQEYLRRVKDKLEEEVEEVFAAKTPESLLEELADLSEIILAFAQAHGFTSDQLEAARISKRETKGGFDQRIYNAFVEVPANNPKIAYYRAQPDKYPEVKD